jgi:hypothetical protein
MKIKAQQEIDVEISYQEARRIAAQFFMDSFNWKPSYTIMRQANGEDWVCSRHTAHSSHVFNYHEKIRLVSEEDYFAARVMEKMFNK